MGIFTHERNQSDILEIHVFNLFLPSVADNLKQKMHKILCLFNVIFIEP